MPKETCVVLGAGASYSYWYPLGEELKEQLCMVGVKHGGKPVTFQLTEYLRLLGYSDSEIKAFQETLGRSPQKSIDRFLELRPDFESIGKAAIAALIIFHEQYCIYSRRRPSLGHLYQLLYHAAFPHPPAPRSSLKIITFNYDLSLERFFAQGLAADCNFTEEQAWKVVDNLQILHIHGSIHRNRIVWPLDVETGKAAASCIKVIHETDPKDEEHLIAIRHRIQQSSKIVFLGFGFDERNIRILDIRNDWPPNSMGRDLGHPAPPHKTVYGTCYGLTPSEIQKATKLFSVVAVLNPIHITHDAHQYLRETSVLDSEMN